MTTVSAPPGANFPGYGVNFSYYLMPDGTVNDGHGLTNAQIGKLPSVNIYGQTEAQWQVAMGVANSVLDAGGTPAQAAATAKAAAIVTAPAPSAVVSVPGGSAVVSSVVAPISKAAAGSVAENYNTDMTTNPPYTNISAALTISPSNTVPVGTQLIMTIEGINPNDRVSYSPNSSADPNPIDLGQADGNGVFQMKATPTTPEVFTNYLFINGAYFTDYTITVLSSGQSSSVQRGIVSPATATAELQSDTMAAAPPASSIFSQSTIIGGVPDVVVYGAIGFAAYKLLGRRAS
jgi:hypothetical protein